MPDFPIDPELRIRARPRVVLRCRVYSEDDTEPSWLRLARRAAELRGTDEWSAMEAVVHLELLLEAEGLLEERPAHASSSGQDRFRAA
jgi:hypothetical protein